MIQFLLGAAEWPLLERAAVDQHGGVAAVLLGCWGAAGVAGDAAEVGRALGAGPDEAGLGATGHRADLVMHPRGVTTLIGNFLGLSGHFLPETPFIIYVVQIRLLLGRVCPAWLSRLLRVALERVEVLDGALRAQHVLVLVVWFLLHRGLHV